MADPLHSPDLVAREEQQSHTIGSVHGTQVPSVPLLVSPPHHPIP